MADHPEAGSAAGPVVEGREQLVRFAKEFDELSASLGRLVIGLTADQFYFKPHQHAWSIAECLEHINLAAQLYLPKMKAAAALAKAAPGADGRRFFDPWVQSIINSNEPPARRRYRSPKAFRPQLGEAAKPALAQKEILERFVNIHREIAGLAAGMGSDRELLAARLSSPVTNLISILFGQSFDLVLVHARRHLHQAELVKKTPGFPLGAGMTR